MFPMPTIQIRQQYARIGLDASPANLEIKQPSATIEMKTRSPKLDIHSPHGELFIDQSKAWDALGVGSNRTFMSRIYTEAKQIALQGIARIVENGKRMAAIQNNTNAIADIAAEQAFEHRGSGINYLGEASAHNVNINYIAHKPQIEVDRGSVDLQVSPNKPLINYNPGKVEIYMLQYPKLEIIPPQIDVKL